MWKLIKHALKKYRLDPFYLWLRLKGIVKYDRKHGTYIRKVRGSILHLNPMDSGISRDLAQDGIREKESVEALFQYVQPDMTIFELGANIGFYVVLEAQILSRGSGRIIALEPSPDNIRMLELNVSANNIGGRVDILYGAVTNKTGTAKLIISSSSNACRLEELSAAGPKMATVDVPAYTFTDVLRKAGVTFAELDFLRMDIEGAEYMIFPELFDLLEQKDKFTMFIEFHPRGDYQDYKETLQRLESIGYRCLTATKEYGEGGCIKRQCRADATICDLYSDKFFLRGGGCEVFLQKS